MALSDSFREKVEAIEKRLQMPQGSLMAVMQFETGGTFDPGVKNKAGSGATGLIQFMPSTAKVLGTSTDALAKMSAEDQLDYVEKYLRPYKGKLGTLQDAYMSVLYPKAIGKPPWYPLFTSGTTAYRQNAGLDRDKKGMVTVGDALAAVQGRAEGMPTTMAQAPGPWMESQGRREGAPAPPVTASAMPGEPAPEPAALAPGATDWAQLLFTAEAPGAGGTGQDWTSVLFG